ncbi:HAMP domain-containing histidine kinase [Roseomonas sp. JC162]|uniref:histidine kinase n=1 Tax=Neoroseomonas marina TaxID=1232220 RepID=A0A848EKT6_9PROT|nr:HAMP domain-containing sensor histidine kinase [Neoroseomonas marina]NMJ44379.1 HAMP domain-containing histidine kinase [Neoroseomonas marina]
MPAARTTDDQPSLLRQLAAIHLCLGLIALVVGAIVLHRTLTDVVWDQHRRSLLASGQDVMQRLRREGVEGLRRPLPAESNRRFDAATGSMRYAVLSLGGEVLAISPGAQEVLPKRDEGHLASFFREGADGSNVWGITERITTPRGPVIVQIAQDMDRSYVVVDDIAPAALWPILTVLATGSLILFGANALLLILMLRPIRRAAAEAARIGRGGTTRLSESGLPDEIRPMIAAVNGGLDRLDEALTWQRAFSDEVAHELRTPLAIMLAELELLDPGPARDRLQRDIEGLSQLVSDLLEAAEASRELPVGDSPFDLAELAREAAARLSAMAERSGHRIVSPPAGPPRLVRGNRDAIGRALRNLLENALAHSPPGAPVDVLMPETMPDEVAVAVADHGRGVPPPERQKVFRRHWRAGDSHRPGLGLGLSIVERVVRAHGGRVEVGDTPGGGAQFTITLPSAAHQPTPEARQRQVAAASGAAD